MPQLIKELKDEHNTLKSLLFMIKNDQMSYDEKLSMVQTSKKKLLEHLQKEDLQLYPVLRNHAETDPMLAQKLILFDKNMGDVTKKALHFYEKYDKGWSGNKRFTFIMDLAELTTLLDRRLKIEEANLYPEYETRRSSKGHPTPPSVLIRLKKLFGL